MTEVYWMNGKTRAQKQKEQLFGLEGKKMGATVTEPRDFFSMVETIQTKANWADQGLEHISFNQAVFFCVKVVHDELIDQLEGKIPLD
tara:strand:+ start:830 stop:1093 length:264 start_codon:yes stop_codon:yes gene_type:complete